MMEFETTEFQKKNQYVQIDILVLFIICTFFRVNICINFTFFRFIIQY